MKKITLKNLHEATAQEVFDQCAVHLFTQMEKSIAEGIGCRYRYEDKACAAGCFIDEAEYDPSMETVNWLALVETKKAPDSHCKLIYDLQVIHDTHQIIEWRASLLELAEDKELNTNAINNLN